MERSYIYLMVETNFRQRVKIGFSKDPLRRARSLYQDIDMEESIFIDVDSSMVRKVERFLHLSLEEYKLKKMETTRKNSNGDTEWFNWKAYKKAKKLMALKESDFMSGKWQSFNKANSKTEVLCP